MTFKQNTKMSAQGSHYCGGGKVKKMAEGGRSKFVNEPVRPTNVEPKPTVADMRSIKPVDMPVFNRQRSARAIDAPPVNMPAMQGSTAVSDAIADKLGAPRGTVPTPLKRGGKVRK